MSTVNEPKIRYTDACGKEVLFDRDMLFVCLQLLDHPQSADEMRLKRGEGHNLGEPLTTLRTMWEGFLVIPQSTPPIGSTVWFICGRSSHLVLERARIFFETYGDAMRPASINALGKQP
jgi:hypothetical protein